MKNVYLFIQVAIYFFLHQMAEKKALGVMTYITVPVDMIIGASQLI
jgi:hypothetical protein